MLSPVDIMPDQYLFADRREDAIKWLLQAPLTRASKERLLLGWGKYVNTRIDGDEYKRVGNSGVDVK